MSHPPEINHPQFRLMAIALIQDGMGILDWKTEQEFANYEWEDRDWRNYVIYKLNGFDLPMTMITLAIHKRWKEFESQNVEEFTRLILQEWKLL